MEESEELRWALKVIIKRQMKHLMELLKENGEEVAVLAVNLEDETCSHFGSPTGECFISEQKNLTKSFLTFCKTKDKIDETSSKVEDTPKTPASKPLKKQTKSSTQSKGAKKPSKSGSSDTGEKVVKIQIPKHLIKSVSDEKVAGVVGRIVAAKLSDRNQLPKDDGDQSKFAELVEAAVQARTLRSGPKRSSTADDGPTEKRSKKDFEVSTPKSTASTDATRTRSGRKISSKYLESINSLRGGRHIKLEQEEEPVVSSVPEEVADEADTSKDGLSEEDQRAVLQQLTKINDDDLKRVSVKSGGKEIDLENTTLDLVGLEHVFGPVLDEIEKTTFSKQSDRKQQVQVVLGAVGQKVTVTFNNVSKKDFQSGEDNPDDSSQDDDATDHSGDETLFKTESEDSQGLMKDPSLNWPSEFKVNQRVKIKVAGHNSNKLKGLKRKPKKRSLTETMLVQCEECGIQVTGKSNLKSHYKRIHLQQRNHKCNICNKGFWSNNARESHMLSVHTRRCEACQEYVVESVPWSQGVDMKTQRDVICTCGAVVSIFSTFGRRRQYLRDDEPDEEGNIPDIKAKPNSGTKYACGTCGKLFMKKSNCERHSRAHTDIKSCQCTVCGYSYAYESSLKKHLKNEHGIVKCVCELCGGNYSSEVALKVHMVRAHQNVALGDNVAIVMQKGDQKTQTSFEEVEVEEEDMEDEEEDITELEGVGAVGEEKGNEVQVVTVEEQTDEPSNSQETRQIIVSESGQIISEETNQVIHQTESGQIIMAEQAHIVETSDGQQIVVSSTGEVIQTDGQIVQQVIQDGQQVVGQDGAMSIIIKQLPM